jgi:hypothetical protein
MVAHVTVHVIQSNSGDFPPGRKFAGNAGRFPDKVTTKPSPGRGTVRISSILRDELKRRAAAAG